MERYDWDPIAKRALARRVQRRLDRCIAELNGLRAVQLDTELIDAAIREIDIVDSTLDMFISECDQEQAADSELARTRRRGVSSAP
jgi:hypothetical protein